jgi:hypothetical protein
MTQTYSRIELLMELMKHDTAEFMRRSGTGTRTIQKATGLSFGALKGLRDPADWHPTFKTLKRIEEAFGRHPDWPGQDRGVWREHGSDGGFVISYPSTEWNVDRFADVISAWRQVRAGVGDVDTFRQFDGASAIDCKALDPMKYRIRYHSRTSVRAGGQDATDRELGKHRPYSYRYDLTSEYCMVKSSDRPSTAEVVWASRGTNAGAYFWRLVLPLGDYLISTIDIQKAGLVLSGTSSEATLRASA